MKQNKGRFNTLCLAVLMTSSAHAQTPLLSDGFEITNNHPPTGMASISGNFRFGQVLTAEHTLADADGLGVMSYQWYADGEAISGATSMTLTLEKRYIGKMISVVLSYTDGNGHSESVTAAVSQAIEGYTQHVTLLNDTGITFGDGYPTGNNSDCSGERISAQDCASGLDADGVGFQFAKINTDGDVVADSASDWACVKDKRTGLIWEKKTTGGAHGKDDTFSWYIRDGYLNGGAVGVDNAGKVVCHGYQADDDLTYCNTQAFIDRVNQEQLCGYDDWRLPYREELRNIADLSKINPSINTDFFPNTLGEFYWSASPFASSVNYAWIYDFYDGYGNFYPRSFSYRVRLVRGHP